MHRRTRALVAGAVVLAACGSSEAASPEAPSTVGGIGELPDALPGASTDPTTVATASSVPTTSDAVPPTTAGAAGPTPIGRLADGNRVLVIGDSILASISNRYGDQLCQQLVPRGWAVEVDAEVGRFIEFGRQVLARRPTTDWDAAIVMLGNNYDGDPDAFARELDALLDELEPRPVLLLTVTRFEVEQDEVNWITTIEAGRRDNVQLLDWTSPTAEGAPGAEELLTGDGLHLTTKGQDALATLISRAMGRAPAGSEGECRRSTFRDDTAGSLPEESGGRSDDDDDGDGVVPTTRPRRPVTTTTSPRAPDEPEPPASEAPEPRPTSPPEPSEPPETPPAGSAPAAT